MVEIIWAEVAVDDLRSIHEYIAKDSAVYAERLIEKLIARVEQLEKFPNLGRIVPEFDSSVIRETHRRKLQDNLSNQQPRYFYN